MFSLNIGRCSDTTAIIGDGLKAEYLGEQRHDSGCKRNAKQKFTNKSSCTEDSADAVCSLNAGKPSPPEVMKIDTNYKPKNKWKCHSNFELHFSLKVNKIYATTVKPHKLHNQA